MKKIIFIMLLMMVLVFKTAYAQDVEIVFKIPEEKFNSVYASLSHEYRNKLPNPDYNGDGRSDWTKEKHLREIVRFIVVKKIESISDKQAAKQAKEDNRADFSSFR